MFAGGEIAAALDILTSSGCAADACRLIADISYAALDQLDVDEATALLD